jgi:transposase
MDMDRASLRALSHDDLISVILAQAEVIAQQAAQNAALTATIALLEKRIAELEEKLGKPPKTPNNSSLPPSAGQKPNLPERERKGRRGRPGVNRALAADPDHVIEALAGMEPGSPFGPGIQALAIHLHVTQAISFERLREMMKTILGLDISEGAIANILQRALKPMLAAAEAIAEEVRCAEVIASDETSARVAGRKHWQWVMHTTTAVYHVIADTRAARVLVDFLAGARPKVWVADRYAAQNGHGDQRQVCLAHLLRDANMPSTMATRCSPRASRLC